MRAVLLSTHWYPSPRRAGFHHLADALLSMGHTVDFVTVGFSYLSYARRDYRTHYPGLWRERNQSREIRPGLISHVFFTPWHPHTLLLPLLDRLTWRWMDGYHRLLTPALRALLAGADVVLYESSSALFLFHTAKALAPQAKHIYRVSDDIRILRSTHPRMVELEQEVAPLFDAVSVPCRIMLNKFPGLPHLHLHPHGLDTASFDAVTESPYVRGTRNAVLVSAWRTDPAFFRAVARHCPEVHVHCIGPLARDVTARNIHYYGEIPFKQTLPYIKFADVGLQVVQDMGASTATLTDNLKVIQYRYCGLPIVAPSFLDLHRDGVFYYHPNPESCVSALHGALDAGKNLDLAQEVRTWEELARDLLRSAGMAL